MTAHKEDMLNTKKNGVSGWSKFLTVLQELGKALQFPVAVLPFAAILNRFGALGITYTTGAEGEITNAIGYWISYIIQKPGSVAFDQLPLLFAIGISFGLAKDHRGEVTMVAAIMYFIIILMTSEHGIPEMLYGNVLTKTVYNADGTEIIGQYSSLMYVFTETQVQGVAVITGATYVLNVGVLGGVVSGVVAAMLYNKFKEIKLPAALSFFGGRRFVPMIGIVAAMGLVAIFAILWPWIQLVLMLMGQAVADPNNPAVAIPGTGLYAFLNRLLLPFGLHQILNTFFWFQMPIKGEIIAPITGEIIPPIDGGTFTWINGDINAFAKGLNTSGLFQSGYFPIMMGGVPAIAAAMIFASKKDRRTEVMGFLGGVALVSFVSGITEPVEFSFVFLSPVLLLVHAGMSAIFMMITTAMQIQIGFGFSAGFIDYAVSFAQSWGLSTYKGGAMEVVSNPLMMLPLIAAAGGAYFVVFSLLIRKLNIQTPGREEDGGYVSAPVDITTTSSKDSGSKADKYETAAAKFIAAIGSDNLESIDNCATRLRLVLKDNKNIDVAAIKATGVSFGIKQLGDQALQIVIGPDVEHYANAMKRIKNV
ncbi:phosphotransferase system IIB component [Spiroplasma sp. TIUS-1]|uniref:PTS transporter subunit EIIC n=1 Tax=Spiroplasma sp. TIUS-1 TaxID=216963 RepID=UPI0013974727|nr:PTS transporter subunit EIIC [Spiroplasma sp. TIUS-1]QHX35855.1 phosphotransferase system IIB component [Spiroplasma sp. TIUS-1]